MREIRLLGKIGSDRTLHLDLPADVGEGAAEVLVRIPGNGSGEVRESHREMLERVRSTIKNKKAWEEIQRIVETERIGWE